MLKKNEVKKLKYRIFRSLWRKKLYIYNENSCYTNIISQVLITTNSHWYI